MPKKGKKKSGKKKKAASSVPEVPPPETKSGEDYCRGCKQHTYEPPIAPPVSIRSFT